jgi:hypothetical protein
VAERDAEEDIVANPASAFDPYTMLAALQARGVSFVVIGAFARVIHGTGEVTDGLDVTPSMREENLSRLAKALDDLDARRADGEELDLARGRGRVRDTVLELDTLAGELKLIPEPAGSHGYDDLRRHASREQLGRGVRPQFASPGDLARMLGALEREHEIPTLLRLRRVIELDSELIRSRVIER